MADKNELMRQPSLLDGYSTDNVDEFLAKALVGDKGQRPLVKRLYLDREEVVPNCDPQLALQAVVTPSFLAFPEGRKLAAHFVVEALECKIFWESVKKQIKLANPNKTLCQHWGDVIFQAWKCAEETPLEEDAVRKKDVESSMIQELFHSIVFISRKYLQKYSWVLDGFLSFDEPTKKINAMLFRTLLPILWRNLDVPNEDVRQGASSLLLRFYPLRSDDDFIDADYFQKQNEAMDRMLMDECLPIRVEAIKKVLYHLGVHWKNFPRNTIKGYLDKIVDQLSFDTAVEVRAAVYEGMEGLLKCGPALNATQHALGLLGKRGINDKTEKVRLAAFRLLNKLKGHRFIKYFDLVDMDDMLSRLDFEHSNAVQSQIVALVYKSYCPKLIDGIDYIERFKRIRYMNKVSRTASLNFHRLIYPLKLATMDQSVRHIRSLLIGVKSMLKKRSRSDETGTDSNDENDDLLLDISGATLLFNEQGDEAKDGGKLLENDDKLNLAKAILDSAIVLWASIRYDLYTKFPKDNVEVIKSMANILRALDPYSNTILMDSALVIASNLPKDRVGRLFAKVMKMIQKGEIDKYYFGHYVEALANWDFDKLIEIITKGLEKLRNFATGDLTQQPGKAHTRDSPPSKRVRTISAEEIDELKRPLEFIKILLASPNTSENLKSHFGVHLTTFCELLSKVQACFGQSLKTDEWKKVDLKLMISAYETFTLLLLMSRDSGVEEIDMDSDDEDSGEFEGFGVGDCLFLKEVKWLESIMDAKFPSNQVIQMFLRCSSLHLDSGKLNVTVLARMARLLNCLKLRVEENPGLESLDEPIRKNALHLSKALEFTEDQLSARRILDREIRPILENFRANQSNNENDVEDDL